MNPLTLIEIGRLAERSEAEFQKSQHGAERRQLEKIAASSRWFLIQLACDACVDRQMPGRPKSRALPDLANLFADNAETIAEAWKLKPGDPRRETLIKKINRNGVTDDTRAVAERYLNARLSGQPPEAARRAIEAWSRFRP